MTQPNQRIALAHDHLSQFGGAEQVLSQFTKIFPSAPLYTLVYNKKKFSFLTHTSVRTSMLQHFPGGISRFKWYLSFMPTAWEQFDFSTYDVVLSSSSAFVKGIITPPQTIHYSYCHTPTRYLWSDTHEYVENLRLPRVVSLGLRRILTRLREWDQIAAQRVNFFIANSAHIARSIKKYYGRESVVIYPPIDTTSFSISDTTDSYYLLVSRLRPYKRVDIAIEAFNNLKLPLVIIGDGEEMARLKSLAKKNIRFLGEVSDAVRNRYLSRCKAFIHPQEEDFGISAVEAMASGRPVIAYKAGGAVETVVPGVSGVLFDEQSWEALAYAILQRGINDLEPTRIRAHAMQFDAAIFRTKIDRLIESAKPDL